MAMTAEEQLFFTSAPVAHVAHYNRFLRTLRVARDATKAQDYRAASDRRAGPRSWA